MAHKAPQTTSTSARRLSLALGKFKMELRTFIKATLLDIINGVSDAQKDAPTGTVAPSDIDGSYNAVQHKVSHLQPVHFEVSVRVEESNGRESKIGVVSSFIGAGIKGTTEKDNSASSVLKFTVPIHLPGGGQSHPNESEPQPAS